MINLSHKYQPIWNSDATIFLMRGGRGSGKSVAGTLFANQLSFEQRQTSSNRLQTVLESKEKEPKTYTV